MHNNISLSIIVPVYNEAANIKSFVNNILNLSNYFNELIIVDTSSSDGTDTVFKEIKHPQLITTQINISSRARQMNSGARLATGEWLFFLHADTFITKKMLTRLHREIKTGCCRAGVFSLGLNSAKLWARFTEFNVNIRTRLFALPYGDQGIFIKRDLFFDKLNGFDENVLMEDLDLVWKLRKITRLKTLDEKIITSSRKWLNQGYWKVTFRNAYKLILFLLGFTSYLSAVKDKSGVLVLVKYPKTGAVKTRLGQVIGFEKAVQLYTALAKKTVRNLRLKDNSYDLFIYYDSRIAPLENYQSWLGLGCHYLAQPNGKLGERLTNGFKTLFRRGYKKIVAVGSDCPDLKATHIMKSLKSLNRYDAVIGPAQDGGYYLIGLNNLREILFENIPWSTDKVFAKTLRQAENANLKVKIIDKLKDIDRAEDL